MDVAEIAALVGGKLQGDGKRRIRGVAALENAGAEELAFAEGGRSLAAAARSRAGCILVPPEASLPEKTIIAVSHPKLALIRAAEALHPAERAQAGIHPTAIVSPSARLSPGVSVAAHAVVEEGAIVGADTFLGAGVFVGRGAEIGASCALYPRVSIYPGARIGNRVIIHAGAVVGADGFGYVFAEGRHQKFPQLGRVVIEDDVEIGANATVDRGSLGTTVIGRGTKIDNLVQIAHNVRIGRHCVIAAQTGISGSAEIGDYAVLGGQVGVGDRVRIEAQAIVGAQAGIPTGKIIRRGSAVWGTPARPMSEFKKIYAHLSNLPNLAAKVRELTRPAGARGKKGG
jgi:UDP-3-O-[3-hydroxymyristoyl] glucosamine N-acyltransferase